MGRPDSLRRRHADLASIRHALDGAPSLSLMLCRADDLSSEARELLARARGLGIEILVESEREMRRMSAGEEGAELIAFEGPAPGSTLDELMSAHGLIFLLVGLRYPGNVGSILRSAEVAGAAGIVLDSLWSGSELTEALRVGMRADRFLPLIECPARTAISAARRAGRRIVALETSGERAIWSVTLTKPTIIVVGGETTGLEAELLDLADDVLRIPTRGFIPSYNVQAAVAMVLGEWMRQDLEHVGRGSSSTSCPDPTLSR